MNAIQKHQFDMLLAANDIDQLELKWYVERILSRAEEEKRYIKGNSILDWFKSFKVIRNRLKILDILE